MGKYTTGKKGGLGRNVLEAVLPPGTCNSQGESKKGQSNTIYRAFFSNCLHEKDFSEYILPQTRYWREFILCIRDENLSCHKLQFMGH